MTYIIDYLPLWLALFLALIWGLLYYLFDTMHGMHAMFDQQFPFFLAVLFGTHNEGMTQISGIFWASLDGILLGSGLGFLMKKIIKSIF
ncbi:MAG: hypothetical protein Kow00108_06910 [Calditrichia bacterium]